MTMSVNFAKPLDYNPATADGQRDTGRNWSGAAQPI